MRQLPFEARVKNHREKGLARERCRHCADEGQIVASLRPVQATVVVGSRLVASPAGAMIEEMGPCPFCQQGHLVEFPASGKPGPWGADGFWGPRQEADLPAPLGNELPLPAAENARRIQSEDYQTIGIRTNSGWAYNANAGCSIQCYYGCER